MSISKIKTNKRHKMNFFEIFNQANIKNKIHKENHLANVNEIYIIKKNEK